MKKHAYKLIPLLVGALSLQVASSAFVIQSSTSISGSAIASTLKECCYLTSNSNKRYTSIKKAIEVANSSSTDETVVVIPSKDNGDYIPTIYGSDVNPSTHNGYSSELTVNSNVTVILPFDTAQIQKPNLSSYDPKKDNSSTNNAYLSYWDYPTRKDQANATIADPCADYDQSNVDTYKMSEVKLAANTNLIINGTLAIGGITWLFGETGQRPIGKTCNKYAQLTLENNSKLTINSGAMLDVPGYIKEESKGNGSLVEVHGTLREPMCIYDFGGGTHTKDSYQSHSVAPFSLFDLVNVQPTLDIYGDGELRGVGGVHTSEKKIWFITIPEANNLIDSAIIKYNDGIIKLSNNSNSYCRIKVDNNTSIPSNHPSTFSKLTANEHKVKLDLYNGASLGTFTLSLNIVGMSVNVDMSSVLFPISCLYDISLHNGNYTIGKKAKFMYGAKLEVCSNASLNISAETKFYKTVADNGSYTSFPSSNPHAYYPKNKGKARLIVNGTCTISSKFGGFIETNTANSVLTLSSFTNGESSNEWNTTDGSKTITEDATGYKDSNNTIGKFTNTTYTSQGTYWFGSSWTS